MRSKYSIEVDGFGVLRVPENGGMSLEQAGRLFEILDNAAVRRAKHGIKKAKPSEVLEDLQEEAYFTILKESAIRKAVELRKDVLNADQGSASDHFIKFAEFYKIAALEDAQAAGVEIHYPEYTDH